MRVSIVLFGVAVRCVYKGGYIYLDDGAGAVGNGQSCGLCDGVGLLVDGHFSRLRAVSGVLRDNLCSGVGRLGLVPLVLPLLVAVPVSIILVVLVVLVLTILVVVLVLPLLLLTILVVVLVLPLLVLLTILLVGVILLVLLVLVLPLLGIVLLVLILLVLVLVLPLLVGAGIILLVLFAVLLLAVVVLVLPLLVRRVNRHIRGGSLRVRRPVLSGGRVVDVACGSEAHKGHEDSLDATHLDFCFQLYCREANDDYKKRGL